MKNHLKPEVMTCWVNPARQQYSRLIHQKYTKNTLKSTRQAH